MRAGEGPLAAVQAADVLHQRGPVGELLAAQVAAVLPLARVRDLVRLSLMSVRLFNGVTGVPMQRLIANPLTFKFVLDLNALPQSSQGNGRSAEWTTAACRVSSDFVPKARPHSAQENTPAAPFAEGLTCAFRNLKINNEQLIIGLLNPLPFCPLSFYRSQICSTSNLSNFCGRHSWNIPCPAAMTR